MHHTIARNDADGGYTKKFVARNVAEVGRDSTDAILRATNFGVDTRCNSAIARNIAPCIRTFRCAIRMHRNKGKRNLPKRIHDDNTTSLKRFLQSTDSVKRFLGT